MKTYKQGRADVIKEIEKWIDAKRKDCQSKADLSEEEEYFIWWEGMVEALNQVEIFLDQEGETK